MVTTIQSELVPENQGLKDVPMPPNASITSTPAFPDALDIIRRAQAAWMEENLMERGYREMATELLEWSETTFVAQAETLPEE